MIFTAENTLLIGSILLFVSIVVGKTGYRFGVPTLLLFLVVGMLFEVTASACSSTTRKTPNLSVWWPLVLSFLGRYGYEIQRNQTYSRSRYRAFHCRSTTYSSFHRTLYLVDIRYELVKYLFTYHYFLLLASTMSSTDSASVFAILRSQKMNLKHNLRPMLELRAEVMTRWPICLPLS